MGKFLSKKCKKLEDSRGLAATQGLGTMHWIKLQIYLRNRVAIDRLEVHIPFSRKLWCTNWI